MGWVLWSTWEDLFWGISLICPYLMSPLPTTKQKPHPELLIFSQLRLLLHWHGSACTSWVWSKRFGTLRNLGCYILRNLGCSRSWRLLTSLNFSVVKDKSLDLIRDQPKGVCPYWAQTLKHTALHAKGLCPDRYATLWWNTYSFLTNSPLHCTLSFDAGDKGEEC